MSARPRSGRGWIARGSLVGLCAPRSSDRDEFLALVQGSRALHRGLVDPPRDPTGFDRYLARLERDDRESYFVRRREDEALVGVINLNEISRGSAHNAFLGYYAGADHAGRGYMTEGLRLVQRHAFRELKLHRLEADIQPENDASIALVRRCGFRFEGTLRRFLKIGGRWRDHLIYACLVEDWTQARRHRGAGGAGVALRWRPELSPVELEALRVAVGWERLGLQAADFVAGCWGSAGAFDDAGRLVAWCGVVSDGVQHAMLVDVMVEPRWQHQGVGTALVRFVGERTRAAGVRVLHVDYVPELAGFYERCGYRGSLAGIQDLTVD